MACAAVCVRSAGQRGTPGSEDTLASVYKHTPTNLPAGETENYPNTANDMATVI